MKCIALVLVAGGCMTTRTVPRSELSAIENRRVGDAVVLETTDVWKTRLDPTSKIRFRNAAGKWSDWLEGNSLYVAKHGVFTPTTINPLDYAVKIEIRGMEQAEREALATSRPTDETELIVEPDGTVIVVAQGPQLQRWINSFFEVVNTLRDYKELRYAMHGKPLGVWSLELPHREPLVLEGEALYWRLDEGMATRYGWRWQDIQAAEVKSFSGSLTLTAIVGVTALSVALAPVALIARGGWLPGDGPRASGGGSGLSRLGGGGSSVLPRGNWKPVLADEQALAAQNLFGGGARRKAMVRVVATAEASLGSFGGHPLLDGGVAMLRVGEAFEIGAGGLHAATFVGNRLWQGGIAFARIGAHLPFDAAHRVAVPLSVDIGGGGDEALGVFARLNWGLRLALPHQMFLGVAPASPTLLNWKHDPARRRGSLMSGLELGIAW